MSTASDREQGFTLIEMLVALAVFSLAALALLRLGGATATAWSWSRAPFVAVAQIVARNLAVEVLSDPEPPAFGALAGEAVNAGRRWAWTRTTARSPEARIQQIEIRVADPEGGPGRATLIVFRRAAS